MTYPISKIDGLGPQAILKLKAVGIRTTDGLLRETATAKGRKILSSKTGISEQQLLDWANFAVIMSVKGISTGKAGLIRASGVSTVRELAMRNPGRLAQAMREINDKKKLVRVLPTEKSVARLIENAGKVPPKISY
jgi:hypothetical protein